MGAWGGSSTFLSGFITSLTSNGLISSVCSGLKIIRNYSKLLAHSCLTAEVLADFMVLVALVSLLLLNPFVLFYQHMYTF